MAVFVRVFGKPTVLIKPQARRGDIVRDRIDFKQHALGACRNEVSEKPASVTFAAKRLVQRQVLYIDAVRKSPCCNKADQRAVFSVNGEAVALIGKRRLLLRGCPLLKCRKAFRIQRGKGRKVRVVRGSDAEGFHGGRKAEQKKCLNSA